MKKEKSYFDAESRKFKPGVLRVENAVVYEYCKNMFSDANGKSKRTRVVGLCPGTGTGKSVFGLVYAVNEYASEGKKVLFIVSNPGAFEETCGVFGVDLKQFPEIYVTSYHWWRTRKVLTPEMKEEYSGFDFIFADEAHNGLSTNAKKILPKVFALSPKAKIVAATATPERHTGAPYTFGPGPFCTCNVLDKNTLAELIRAGKVNKPVACCVEALANETGYSALKNYSTGLARNLRGCLPKINITEDTEKVAFIVFFQTIEDMMSSGDYLKEMFSKAFEGYSCGKNIYLYNGCSDRRTDTVYEVHGDIRHTIQYLDNSDKNGVHVICTCRALSESYHKTLNGIILFQRTKSKPLITQEVGRCVKINKEHKFVVFDVLCTKDRLVDYNYEKKDDFYSYLYNDKASGNKRRRSKVEEFARIRDEHFGPLEDSGITFDFQPFDILDVCSNYNNGKLLNDTYDYTLGSWFANLDSVKDFIDTTKTNWHRINNVQTQWLNTQLSKMIEGKLTRLQYKALESVLGKKTLTAVLRKAGKNVFTPLEMDDEGMYYVYNMLNDKSNYPAFVKALRIKNTYYKIKSMSDILIKMSEYVLQSNERFALSVMRGNRFTIVCCSDEAFDNAGDYEGADYLKAGYIMDAPDGRKFYCNTDKTFFKDIFDSLLKAGDLSPYDVAVGIGIAE